MVLNLDNSEKGIVQVNERYILTRTFSIVLGVACGMNHLLYQKDWLSFSEVQVSLDNSFSQNGPGGRLDTKKKGANAALTLFVHSSAEHRRAHFHQLLEGRREKVNQVRIQTDSRILVQLQHSIESILGQHCHAICSRRYPLSRSSVWTSLVQHRVGYSTVFHILFYRNVYGICSHSV